MTSVYPDTNGNGIPDAFENRQPISEILSRDPDSIAQSKCQIDPSLLDRNFRLFVGPLLGGKAILLEIPRSVSEYYGACVFDSKEALQEFIHQLQMAGAEAFGTE